MWNESKAGRLRERCLYDEVRENRERWELSAKKSLKENLLEEEEEEERSSHLWMKIPLL
jgi:hypothetical protein